MVVVCPILTKNFDSFVGWIAIIFQNLFIYAAGIRQRNFRNEHTPSKNVSLMH